MIPGCATSCPPGDINDMVRDIDVVNDVNHLGGVAYITLVDGYGGFYYATIVDGIVQDISIVGEGQTYAAPFTVDANRNSHIVTVAPNGDWPDGADVELTAQQTYDEAANGDSIELSWSAISEVLQAWNDDDQFSGWTLSGVQRYTNCQISDLPTRARINLRLTTTAGVHMLQLYSGATLVASGSRTGDGSITLAEQNDSGLSGSVTLAYTNDLAAADDAWVEVRWAASYEVHCATSLSFPRTPEAVVYENGLDNFTAIIGPLYTGTYSYLIRPITDTGITSTTTTAGTISVPAKPLPPGFPYLDDPPGDWTATNIAFRCSLDPSATYRVYDSALNQPTDFTTPVATVAAGVGPFAVTLPSLAAAAAGVRRVVVVAVVGGVEDTTRRSLRIEYDSSGDIVLPRPNAPEYSLNAISGLSITTKYTYSNANAAAVATEVQLFVLPEADWPAPDWSTPTSETSIASGGGTLSYTASTAGWYKVSVRTKAANGSVSSNTTLIGPFYLSAEVPGAPGDLAARLIA